jgi:hypothetical protein
MNDKEELNKKVQQYIGWFGWFRPRNAYRGGQFYWWRKPEYPDRDVAAYTLSRHGVHIGRLKKLIYIINGHFERSFVSHHLCNKRLNKILLCC